MERTDFCTSVPPHIHPPMAQVPCATTEAVIPDCPRGLYIIMSAGSAIRRPYERLLMVIDLYMERRITTKGARELTHEFANYREL
jgi:hypothetical protein